MTTDIMENAKVKIMLPTDPSDLLKTVGYYTLKDKESEFYSLTKAFELTWDHEEIQKYIGKIGTVTKQGKSGDKLIDAWYVAFEEFPSFKVHFPRSALQVQRNDSQNPKEEEAAFNGEHLTKLVAKSDWSAAKEFLCPNQVISFMLSFLCVVIQYSVFLIMIISYL